MTVGKSAGRRKIPRITEYGTVNQTQDFWTKSPEVERSFECTWERTKTRHPAQPIAKLNVPDVRRVFPKGLPCLYFTTRRGILHEKLFLNLSKIFYGKKEVKNMSFFTTAVTGLKTVVTAIGAGVAVWGVINLLEGYGNDNPGAKSQGVKQLMSGGGIIIVAQTVIPQLATLFS